MAKDSWSEQDSGHCRAQQDTSNSNPPTPVLWTSLKDLSTALALPEQGIHSLHGWSRGVLTGLHSQEKEESLVTTPLGENSDWTSCGLSQPSSPGSRHCLCQQRAVLSAPPCSFGCCMGQVPRTVHQDAQVPPQCSRLGSAHSLEWEGLESHRVPE